MLLLLIIISAIPNRTVEKNVNRAQKILEKEGARPEYFFKGKLAAKDNFSDVIIIDHVLVDESENLIERAMHKKYARYWHGHSVFTRPLFAVFGLYQIRYLMMVCTLLMFGTAAFLIEKKINIVSAVAFLIAVSMTYLIVVATSMQLVSVFLISFAAIIAELLKTIRYHFSWLSE